MEKFFAILDLCDTMGVHTRPVLLKSPSEHTVALVPLFSWYEPSFGPSRPLNSKEKGFDSFCFWPPEIGEPGRPHFSSWPGIASFFLSLNKRRLATIPTKVDLAFLLLHLCFTSFINYS